MVARHSGPALHYLCEEAVQKDCAGAGNRGAVRRRTGQRQSASALGQEVLVELAELLPVLRPRDARVLERMSTFRPLPCKMALEVCWRSGCWRGSRSRMDLARSIPPCLTPSSRCVAWATRSGRPAVYPRADDEVRSSASIARTGRQITPKRRPSACSPASRRSGILAQVILGAGRRWSSAQRCAPAACDGLAALHEVR